MVGAHQQPAGCAEGMRGAEREPDREQATPGETEGGAGVQAKGGRTGRNWQEGEGAIRVQVLKPVRVGLVDRGTPRP